MICYRLRCRHDHQFEGWYKDSATFAMLQQKGLLTCPECGDAEVQQALMAPAIAKSGVLAPQAERSAPQVEQGSEMPDLGSGLSDQAMVALQKVRQAVEQNCENMKDQFAREALRIHHGEAPERGIYGSATEHEKDMLREEGVNVLALPWVRRADS
ncbi:MAG: DUF1178 family protein [Acetobacter sp.]|uniref:DUF1178 family protein n=1 Tax=Acetobacter sp. TaxID=440 RepID=UPI003F8F9F53